MLKTQINKNELRQNLRWCPNDRKPKDKLIKLRKNLGRRPNIEKSKEQTIMFRQNLVTHPNDDKQNEQRINKDRTYDGVPMMRNKVTKKKLR